MTQNAEKFVAYLRVSTDRQGRSGLGLQAQREAVERFVSSQKGRLALPEYVEVESGKNDDRPELARAMKQCRLTGATLVVAKLDRLSRNAAFLLTLRDSGVRFVAADLPEANTMTVGVMAVVAQHEREAISARTKAALAAAKARGKKLGGRRDGGTRIGLYQSLGVAAAAKKADQRASELQELLDRLRADGLSFNAISRHLNEQEILTARGVAGGWTPTAVVRIFARLDSLSRSRQPGRLHAN